jgi:plastocyanin domain-containing protein
MKKKSITISLLIVLILIVGTYFLTSNENEVRGEDTSKYVYIEDGIQIINVTASNQGYTPKSVEAKAGIKTVLRMESLNTYGCERSFRIPSMDITEILPTQGSVDIPLGTPNEGENIFGSCSMGMYTLKISFK